MGGSDDFDVVVVGAGLAGLVVGVVAARGGASVTVCDRRSAGGRARSSTREGFVLNQGPHALFRGGAGAVILGRLGVTFRGTPPNRLARGYRTDLGEFGRMPTSAGSLVVSPLLNGHDKVKMARLLARLPRYRGSSYKHLSAADWIASLGLTDRGLGVLSTLARVVTYSGNLSVISAEAAIGQLQLALKGVLYLDVGWQSLVDGLVTALTSAGGRLLVGQPAVEIQARMDGTLAVRTQSANLVGRAVVVAAGSPAMARALLPSPPSWRLGWPAKAACLDLGLRRVPTTKVAYGLDQPTYLSVHSPAAELAPAGCALVHVMRYGTRSSGEDRAELWELARRCGITQADVLVERFLHDMTVAHA